MFSLAMAMLLFLTVITRAMEADRHAILAAAIVLVLGARWVAIYNGRFDHPWLELVDGAGLLLLGILTHPVDILLLVYARLCIRALELRGRRIAWVGVVYVSGFALATGITAISGRLTTPLEELLFLATGFPLAVLFVQTLGESLIRARSLSGELEERRELESMLRHQAFHDALTGLANRALFRDRVEMAIARRRREPDHGFAVLFIDLDNFKSINDTVGHGAGDHVLTEVARRIRASVRPSDTTARLSGDEFAVLLEELPSESAVIRLVKRIADTLNNPVHVEDDDWFISGSIGIAFPGPGADTVDAILRSADVAMYDAKRRGRAQFTVFEPAMHQAVIDKMTLESDLRAALIKEELSLAYQPQMDLRTNRLVGVEALARWRHPQRGLISPTVFIPLAEETGLIGDLDAWVLKQVVRQVQEWDARGLPPIWVGVNISGREFGNSRLADRITRTVEDAGVAPRRIELEVTESAAFEAENARSILTNLRFAGFSIAIDDFGIGYSMLSRLQDLPVDRLKIDRSFIQKITFGEDEAPIVTGIIAMAHSLKLKVVAEGIETTEQLAFLRRAGCDQGQGYRLARPADAEGIESLLRPTLDARKEEG